MTKKNEVEQNGRNKMTSNPGVLYHSHQENGNRNRRVDKAEDGCDATVGFV
jgi:hypothetical protein